MPIELPMKAVTTMLAFLAIILIGIFFVAGCYHAWQVWSLVVNYGEAQHWTSWWERDNLWTWIIVFLVLAVATWLLMIAFAILRSIVAVVSMAFTRTPIPGILVYWMLSVAAAFLATQNFTAWAEAHPTYSTFFAHTPWWSYFFLFVAFLSVVYPTSDEANN